MRVPFEQVLVGDLVLVTVGDMVPADGVLIESLGLKVDEDLFVRGHDPDDVRTKGNNKNAFDSPFLSAGGLVLEGEGMFLVTGVGAYSNWNTLDAEGLGTRASLSKLGGVVPLRRPLERQAFQSQPQRAAVCPTSIDFVSHFFPNSFQASQTRDALGTRRRIRLHGAAAVPVCAAHVDELVL
jgi:hypothetical protein